MKKRIVSMILSAMLIVGNMNGLEIKAADNNTEERVAEVSTVTLDAPEEEELEWTRIGDVAYMPEGITRIEESEFEGFGGDNTIEEFQGVKKLVLPSTLEYIGDFAFKMCELEEIVIPGNVKEIGNDAFWGCDNLKKVIIEDGVEKIGSCLFCNCENLETVVMPKSVKDWDTSSAFMWCYSLKNITLPEEGMDIMGTGMFYACEALEELIIPECVTTMNYGVILGCDNLKLLKAGYNVVNFEKEKEPYPYKEVNFTLGCFGTGCSGMVLEAPLDSAIVEYARYYRYFTVKYDYPDFERVEYSCDGEILVNPDYSTNKYGTNKYLIYFDFDIYPKNSDSHVKVERLTYNTFKTAKEDSPISEYDYIYRTWQPDGVNYYSKQERIAFRMDGEWEDGYYPELNYMPTVEYFKIKCYSQGEDFEDELVDEKYFKVVLTKQSFEKRKIQIEILKDGTWDGEDAQWELITPAIDTSILTPTPVPTKEVTPTTTPEPEKVTAEAPRVTGSAVQPTSKPVVTVKATPTPAKKTVKPAKVNLKATKQLTTKKRGKKVYTKAVKVSWKKTKNADGYVVYMKAGKGKYKAVKTITNGKTVNYTKKNLKKGKTYYFKVRAYRKVNGQKVYGNYSGVKKIKIK